MLLKKLRNLFFSLLAMLLILLATITALIETEAGSRWVVNQFARVANISLGEMNGNLRSGMDLAFIDYSQGEYRYHAEQVSFRWRPAAMLYGAVAIQSLRAQNLLIKTPLARNAKQSAQPFSEWPSLALPVRISLDKLIVKNVEYVQGSTRRHWQKISGSVSLGTFHLRYTQIELQHTDYQLLLSGVTNLRFPYDTDARLQWQWQNTAAPNSLVYMGVTELKGDLQQLQLHNQMSLPVVLSADVGAQLVNQQRELQTTPALSVALMWQAQTLPAAWWIPAQPQPMTSGTLTATGNWQTYSLQLDGDIHLPDAPALAISAAAVGDLEKINIANLVIGELDSANALGNKNERGLQLAGDVRWLPELAWQLNVNAKRLNLASVIDNWPSDINVDFATRGMRQQGEWSADVQQLQMSGELRGVNVQGDGDVFLQGKKIRSNALHFVAGANQLRISGELGDEFNVDWMLNAPLLAQLDESLSGSVVSSGALRGNWKRPRVQLQASMEKFSFKHYAVDELELDVAPEVAPEISAMDNRDVPADKTALSAVVDELLNDQYKLTFNAKQLRIAQQHFSTLKIEGAGSINQHQLAAVIKSSAYGHTDFKLAGNYDGQEWQGNLTQLALKVKRVPRWWLTASKPIKINAHSVSLGSQCFTTRSNLTAVVENAELLEREQLLPEWLPNQSPAKNPHAWLDQSASLPASRVERYSLPQLCIDGEWASATGASVNAKLDSIPLRQFLALFKVEVYFAGVMDGSLHLTSQDLSLANTKLNSNISTRNAELRYQYAGGATEVYAWRDFAVRAHLDKSLLDVAAGMEWVGYGKINANTQLDLARQKISRGTLQAQFDNLAPLETLITYANDVKGDFRADLSLGGSFAQPNLLGEVSLRNGTANLPRLGLDLANIELQIDATQAGNLSLVAGLQSGDGRLSLVGDVSQFGTPDWQLQGSVNGANVKVVGLSQLKATVSPDLKLSANRKRVNLTGAAVIPWARANIKRLPESATQVSRDAVIVNESAAPASQLNAFDFLTNLKLSLGDDVQFKGFGLNSKLSGKLSLLKEPQRPFFTNGYVSVANGSYKAYGQTLTIDRGRLVFQGPYENPGLDIRASRIIKGEDGVKVGLDINGTLQRPIADVFSVPAEYSESQAMMMLLTGKPASEATKADASMLVGAMGGLGMDSDGSIATEITRFFRLDELEVKSDDGIDQSQLWIGKYLTPKLLVRYVVGIFDNAFSLGMEYQLTKQLRLEAESGEAQSVDVIYKIER